jgi:hypothetical protein
MLPTHGGLIGLHQGLRGNCLRRFMLDYYTELFIPDTPGEIIDDRRTFELD